MRYEPAPKEIYTLMNSIRDEHFEELNNVNFELVYDTKRRVKDGKITFATCKKADELIQYFATEDVDYVIFLDKNIWETIDEKDKIRILRHELRHPFIDARTEDVKYKIRPHDFEAFKDDIEIESRPGGDPLWTERILLIAESIYDKEELSEEE